MLRSLIVLLLIASAAAALAAWLISPAMAENWALQDSAAPEAALEARALLWLVRGAAPVIAAASWICLRRWKRTERAGSALGPDGSPRRIPAALLRGGIAVWLLLALVHWTAGARRVVREWPVYRFRSGAQVLPNMSESNRAVIRYLAAATPDDARILVASDQTLYFLSYYLWPREIMQRRHPDSEFTVPQPGRQLAAYRLSDLSDEDFAAIAPDFVLEYFEGPEYVQRDRLLADARWIDFVRRLHGDPSYVPSFSVRLRAVGDARGQP
jgi:hypothetical protein